MQENNNKNEISISGWKISAAVGQLPSILDLYLKRASFVDQIDMAVTDHDGVCYYAISTPSNSFQGGLRLSLFKGFRHMDMLSILLSFLFPKPMFFLLEQAHVYWRMIC